MVIEVSGSNFRSARLWRQRPFKKRGGLARPYTDQAPLSEMRVSELSDQAGEMSNIPARFTLADRTNKPGQVFFQTISG